MFTWIPIYEEIARKILEFENRQAELLLLLGEMRTEGLKVIQLNDRDSDGKVIPLAEIDPLTFFASFNRTSSVPGRQAILKRIKDSWSLTSPVPEDFTGIPLANAQNSWAFAYAADREPNDIPILWKVAREAVAKNWQTFDQNLFNEALGISQMGLARMSMSLFWMKPRAYLSLDKNTRAYFERKGIVCESKTASGYHAWMEQVVAKIGDNFPQISTDAYQENGGEEVGDGEFDNDKQAKSWKFTKWMGPLLDALRDLGGASSPKQVQQQIQNMLKLPADILNEKNKSGQAKFYNELHWARKFLVWEGLLESQPHGQWVLSKRGKETILDEFEAQTIAEKWAKINKQPSETESEEHANDAYQLHEDGAAVLNRNYWTLSAGEGGEMWEDFYQNGIAAIGWDDLGDLTAYKDKEVLRAKLKEIWPADTDKKNDTHACWQFAHEIRVGDIIFAKQGFSKLLGYGVVESGYHFDDSRPNYQHVHKVKWLANTEVELAEDEKMAMKTLTDITPYSDFVKLIAGKIGLELGENLKPITKPVASSGTAYWWLNANPKIWDFRTAPIGSHQTYTSLSKKGKKRRIYDHFQVVKPGDLMIGYVTTPDKEVVGLCEITKALHITDEGEVIEFKKIEQFPEPITWAELQTIPDLEYCEPLQNNQGSLFALTKPEYDAIRELIDAQELDEPVAKTQKFTKAEALDGLFMSEQQLDSILALVKRKKALILQGPPGVGKTFVAQRIAYTMMGQKDERRVNMVQFHPSYGYEDFIQGYRPTSKNGLERRDGVFYQFARLARNNPDQDWFFIIDEINRGNLAKIFGELLMLLEADKRGLNYQISLTYSDKDERFYLPENVYVIGTMNTADRSLAMVDYALRRRFAFETLKPAIDSTGFETWLMGKGADKSLVEKIKNRIGSLNEKIGEERDLGERFRIGHSFFCPRPDEKPDEAWYQEIIRSEIKPLLEEYFDSSERVKFFVDELLK